MNSNPSTQKPHISQRIDKLLLQLAVNIGPWFVPVSAALVFGVMFRNAVASELGQMAVAAGVFAALGLEIAGIVSFHVAVSFYSAKQMPKAAVALALGAAYVIIGIVGVWAIDTNESFRTVGTITFLLVPIVYFSRALAKDLEFSQEMLAVAKTDKKALLDDNRQKQWNLQIKKLDLGQQAQLATIEANRAVRIAEAEAQHAGKLPPSSTGNTGSLPAWLPERPADLAHFRQLVNSGSASLPADLTGAELSRIIDRSPRTGQNWLAAVRNGC